MPPLTDYAVHLRDIDNIAVAVKAIPEGRELQLNGSTIVLQQAIPMGHKFAVVPIAMNANVLKFGQIIGTAERDIDVGEHVHVHNVKADKFERDYEFAVDVPKPMPMPKEERSFMGFDRGPNKPEHQRYGTRNYVAIISTVNCSASASKYIAEKIKATGMLRDYPNIDGVVPITHRGGCAMAYEGPDHRQLERTLAGFARHPNIVGYILIGPGLRDHTSVTPH